MIVLQHPRILITHRVSRIVALLCSCAALIAEFHGLLQLDLPIVRYVRSVTIHLPWDQLTIPWMAFTSDTGDWIGEGWNLAMFSAVLLAIGWTFSLERFSKAGIETLLAHGLTALISNGLKHLVGRPRPKFVHSGEWHFAPSWESGLDSFPSGHTAATFAVATVLAKRFPVLAPIWLSIAVFVGISRILRGAHFPTDIFAGAILGLLSGSIVAAPLANWRTSLEEGLRRGAVGGAIMFAVLWIFARPADPGLTGSLLIGVGACAVAGGVWFRWKKWLEDRRLTATRQDNTSLALIAFGLACLTTAPLVATAAGFASLASSLSKIEIAKPQKPFSYARALAVEGGLVVVIAVSLLILFSSRDVLPF